MEACEGRTIRGRRATDGTAGRSPGRLVSRRSRAPQKNGRSADREGRRPPGSDRGRVGTRIGRGGKGRIRTVDQNLSRAACSSG